MLINITGLCLFLTVASAPAWNRLYAVSLPALIMLVWFLSFSFKMEQALLRMLWALVVVLAIVRPIETQLRWRGIVDLPTGRTAFFEPGEYEEIKWLTKRVRSSEYFFGDQMLCLYLKQRNPARVAYVTPYAFTRPEEVQNLIQGLEAHKVRFVTWYAGLDTPTDPKGNYLGPLRRYLEDHYYVAASFSNGHKIWQRRLPSTTRSAGSSPAQLHS